MFSCVLRLGRRLKAVTEIVLEDLRAAPSEAAVPPLYGAKWTFGKWRSRQGMILVKRILRSHVQQPDASAGEAVVDRWLIIARDLLGPIRPAIGDADARRIVKRGIVSMLG